MSNWIGTALGVVGGVVGGIYGGPVGAAAGSSVGKAVGGAIEGDKNETKTANQQQSSGLNIGNLLNGVASNSGQNNSGGGNILTNLVGSFFG